MDMKKILSAVDKAENKQKTSSGDMKKFLSIINESTTNRLSVAEQMAVQHYQEPRKDITSPVLNKSKDAAPSMIGKYFKKIEAEIEESEQRYKDRAQLLAERVVAKMNEKTADVDAAVKDYLNKGGEVKKGKTHKPRKSEKTDFGSKHIGGKGEVSQGKATKIGKSAKTTPAGKPVVTAEDLEHLIRIRDNLNEQISQLEEYYNAPPTDSKSPISGGHVKGCQCKEVAEGLKDPKDNPCWKGYKPVGTKQKNGRTVPNCVPKESKVNEISKGTAQKYLDKTVDPVHGMPKSGMNKRMKGIEAASKRVSGQKPTSKNEGVQKTGEAGQLKGKDKVSVNGSLLASNKEKSQKGLRNKLVGGGT